MHEMRVATYNIHRCIGTDGRYDPERIVQVIRELDADILALQEIDSHSIHEEGHQINYILKQTHYHVAVSPTLFRTDSAYGNAILTRYPIVTINRLDVSYKQSEPRGAIDVLLKVPAGKVRVLATHFGLGYRERAWQTKRLLRLAQSNAERNTIVLGDFNEWVPFFVNSTRRLSTSFKQRVQLKSFPSSLPMFSLDRIYLSKTLQLGDTRVHRSDLARSASDHLPVIAQIKISSASA